MSDLISRQKLLKELTINRDGKRIPEVDIDNFPVTLTISQAKELIKNAPTAYDVDEVLENLENKTFSAEVYNDDFNGVQIDNLLCMGDVYEILKEGGEGE